MSIGPNNIAVTDLFDGGGTATGTRAGRTVALPPGKKAVSVTLVTSATCTVKIQNSVDATNWFDVSSSTASTQSYIAEVESAVPFWRVNVTSHTTSGTSSAALFAYIAQSMVGN